MSAHEWLLAHRRAAARVNDPVREDCKFLLHGPGERQHVGGYVFRSASHLREWVEQLCSYPHRTSLSEMQCAVFSALVDERHPAREALHGRAEDFGSKHPAERFGWCVHDATRLALHNGEQIAVDVFVPWRLLFRKRGRGLFSDACREAVWDTTREVRTRLLASNNPRCPLTGDTLSHDNTDLDHAPPWEFAVIVRAFCEERRIDRATFDGYDVAASGYLALPPQLRREFSAYHDERVSYRLLSRRANQWGDIAPCDLESNAEQPQS